MQLIDITHRRQSMLPAPCEPCQDAGGKTTATIVAETVDKGSYFRGSETLLCPDCARDLGVQKEAS